MQVNQFAVKDRLPGDTDGFSRPHEFARALEERCRRRINGDEFAVVFDYHDMASFGTPGGKHHRAVQDRFDNAVGLNLEVDAVMPCLVVEFLINRAFGRFVKQNIVCKAGAFGIVAAHLHGVEVESVFVRIFDFDSQEGIRQTGTVFDMAVIAQGVADYLAVFHRDIAGKHGVERAQHKVLRFQLHLERIQAHAVAHGLFHQVLLYVAGNEVAHGGEHHDKDRKGNQYKAAQRNNGPEIEAGQAERQFLVEILIGYRKPVLMPYIRKGMLPDLFECFALAFQGSGCWTQKTKIR